MRVVGEASGGSVGAEIGQAGDAPHLDLNVVAMPVGRLEGDFQPGIVRRDVEPPPFRGDDARFGYAALAVGPQLTTRRAEGLDCRLNGGGELAACELEVDGRVTRPDVEVRGADVGGAVDGCVGSGAVSDCVGSGSVSDCVGRITAGAPVDEVAASGGGAPKRDAWAPARAMAAHDTEAVAPTSSSQIRAYRMVRTRISVTPSSLGYR